jgi:hypothetical protein
MVVFVEPRILLGFSSLRYAACYFALVTNSIAVLVDLPALREKVVRPYGMFVDEAEAEAEVRRLVEAGQL